MEAPCSAYKGWCALRTLQRLVRGKIGNRRRIFYQDLLSHRIFYQDLLSRSLSTRLIAQLIVRLILAMYVINDNVTTLLQDKAYQGGSVDMFNIFELFLFGV